MQWTNHIHTKLYKKQAKPKQTNQNQVQNYYFITHFTNVPFCFIYLVHSLSLSFKQMRHIAHVHEFALSSISKWFVIDDIWIKLETGIHTQTVWFIRQNQSKSLCRCESLREREKNPSHNLRGELLDIHITPQSENDLCKSPFWRYTKSFWW